MFLKAVQNLIKRMPTISWFRGNRNFCKNKLGTREEIFLASKKIAVIFVLTTKASAVRVVFFVEILGLSIA